MFKENVIGLNNKFNIKAFVLFLFLITLCFSFSNCIFASETIEPAGEVSWNLNETFTYPTNEAVFTYVKDSTKKFARITFAKLSFTGGDIVFPTFIDDLRVICIQNTIDSASVFTDANGSSSSSSQAILLPEYLETIGDCAFKNYTLLQSLYIPETVTTIGQSAFNGCSDLVTINLPPNITSIPNYAFGQCSNLTGELIISDKIESIGEGAFLYCSKITKLVLGKNLKTIGLMAFSGCSGIKGALIIPENVTSIGGMAFVGNTALNYAVITNPELATNSGGAFSGIKLYALTQEIADLYNTNANWQAENNNEGLIPMLKPVKSGSETYYEGFVDEGAYTLMGGSEDATGNFRVRTEYSVNGGMPVDYLRTNMDGTHTASYVLQQYNEETEKYEDVYNSTGVEKVSREIIINIDNSEYMITEWTISGDNKTIILPVKGDGLHVDIDWGDGTFSGDVTTEFPTHKYDTADTYYIKVSGTCPEWGYKLTTDVLEDSPYYTYTQYLTGLRQWGELQATHYGFAKCKNLKYVSGDATDNTFDKVNIMTWMFYGCLSLETIDLSNFDTSNIGSTQGMFSNCKSLKTLDLRSFDTSNVVNMGEMFNSCVSLESIDLSSFNTSQVKDMGFFICNTSLTTLDLSSFDTSNVTEMKYMIGNLGIKTDLSTLILGEKFNTSKVTDFEGFFSGLHKLKSIDLSKIDISNATSIALMFWGCTGLTSLDLTNFDTSNVTNMKQAFQNCTGLTSLDVSNLKTDKVTNMDYVFAGCTNLTALNVSKFNTSNVTSMKGTFWNLPKVTKLDVSGFDTSKVTNMQGLFGYCSGLTSLDLSNFDTSKVTNMKEMFYNNKNLKNLDISNFNTSKVTNMASMFGGCSGLVSIDIENLDTSRVTTMNKMFYKTSNLKSALISNKFIISGDTTDMFTSANSALRFITVSQEPVENQFKGKLSTIPTSTLVASNILLAEALEEDVRLYVPNGTEDDYINALEGDVDETQIAPIIQPIGGENIEISLGADYNEEGYKVAGFTEEELSTLGSGDKNLFGFNVETSGDVKTDEAGEYQVTYTLTKTYMSGDKEVTTTQTIGTKTVEVIDTGSYMITEWTISGDNITIKLPVHGDGLNVDIDWGDGTTSGDVTSEFPTHKYDTAGTYYIRVKGICPEWGYASDSEVLNDSPYYTYTQYLTGLRQWGDLQAIKYGFAYCGKLTYVSGDATDKTFEKVTDMGYMFRKCISLSSIDLSNFNTSNVTIMHYLFSGCSSLTSLDLSSFDTLKTMSMGGMFAGCQAESIDVSSFDTSNVIDMSYMFMENRKLKTLDLSNFNTSKVQWTTSMFYLCTALTDLNISNFNTANVTSMNGMFQACTKLEKLDVSSFDTSKVSNMRCMFNNCYALKKLDVTHFDTSNVTNMENMFTGLREITTLDISNLNTSNVTKMRYMFYDCSALNSILISNKFIISGDTTNMLTGANSALRFITVSQEPVANQFKGMLTGEMNLYVPNGSIENYKVKLSGDTDLDHIKPILESTDGYDIKILKGEEYNIQSVTIAGYETDDTEGYAPYGYFLEISGDVDTAKGGKYKLEYKLNRTH